MDHEFGTNRSGKDAVGWDWFSVQLDGGVALMFAQIRNKDGSSVGIFSGTLAWPMDVSRSSPVTISMSEAIDQWISPRFLSHLSVRLEGDIFRI